MKNFKPDKNNALLFIIGGLSLVNIGLQLRTHNYLSIGNSVIGLAGVGLFLMDKWAFRYLIWFWIFAQAVIIEHTVADHAAGVTYTESIFDLSQIFHLKIGFFASGNTNTYGLNFNAVVIMYFFLFRNLKTSSYTGRRIELLFMRGDLDLQFEEGTFATLGNRVNLDGDDNWLLGQLNTPIIYNKNEYDRVLVHAEDGLLTHIFRLVPNRATIGAGINPTLQFERASWIMIG
jgi:hypothetical protein